ncbi:unnamed protein product [Mycena citricolor]|uniref:Zn(2)-C6 fungal-type domain-containing protein n=1 Tax=Mycena citricolor TaxID=2018698 RepID=A0AAD2GZM4_9AGAR|nr:unnamed protein product [Mycena citricolor]
MDGFGQNYPSAPELVDSATNLANTPQRPVSASSGPAQETDDSRKGSKRRKVNHACLYCRRSHMTCDEGRPCQRCIKREIGHLCHDERKSKGSDKQSSGSTPVPNGQSMTFTSATQWNKSPYLIQPETLGNEFSMLSDFLETLDEGTFFSGPTPQGTTILPLPVPQQAQVAPAQPPPITPSVILAATKTERFLLTAADQESGSRDERLNRVIRSKYEAGLLKPYNYVKGYARLSRWMDRNVSQESKQQILQPLSVLRPKFRAVAQSLRDIDLVFIEEAFERLLLDYDRVFSAMGVPACLWRRTGEIYKGNREFSELVGVSGEDMREGRLCIYELMSEESAVNYWEKYGNVAFDSSQKAVLTTCVLRYKPVLPSSNSLPNAASEVARAGGDESPPMVQEEGDFINCCFSFTIRRDKWGIPTMIVGNFIQT